MGRRRHRYGLISGLASARGGPFRALALAVFGCLLAGMLAPAAAHAQGFPWPWGNDAPSRPPVPREPVYRAPAPPPPPAQSAPAPGAPPQSGWGANSQGGQAGPASICLTLEQRLVQDSQHGTQSRDQLPKLEADIRLADRAWAGAQQQLERADCYDYFLFSKSLRRTRACVELSNQADAQKRHLGELQAQRLQIVASAGRSYQDDIIRELARNGCGGTYAQEARKRDGGSSIWQDDESPPSGGGSFGALPFATYRTLCVRLCDGYYFPISFSTLPNHFQRDADSCQSHCAAPVELYYYQNPGGAPDQMVAMKSQEPYARLKTAFRYRKEFVQGCSCKQAEYVGPQTPVPPGALTPDRRAEAKGWPIGTVTEGGAPSPKTR